MENRRLLAGNVLGGEWLGINAGREATATAIAPVLSDLNAVGLKALRSGGNVSTSTSTQALTDQDALIDSMVAAGQEVHWVINFRGNGINPAGTGRTEIAALDINGATMTTWFNNYKARCIQLFTRYSSPGNVKIENYIVGNEPDLNDNFTSLAGRPDIAVQLTRAMWEAAEQVNPAIIVESPPTGSPNSLYLQSMINGGVAAYSDVIGVHMYGDQTQWGKATKPWEWLAAAGVTNKPVAVSEAGVTTGWNPAWSSSGRQWQSDWLNDFYVMGKRFGYSYGLLFTHDDDHTADWALLRAGGAQVQPSWNEIDNTLTNPQGLRNAGFETANDVRRQWYIERDIDNALPTGFNWQHATNPRSGSASAQIRTNASWDISVHQVIDNLTPGVPVTVTGWVRSDSAAGARIDINGSQAFDGDATFSSPVVTSTGWTQVSATVTPTNPWIVVSLITRKNSTTSHVYFDDITVQQADPTLKAHYRFENNAVDSAGGDQNGTLVNGPVFSTTTVKEGAASLLLDGSDDHVSFGTFDTTNTFTIAGWFRIPTGRTNAQTLIANASSGNNATGYRLFVNTANTTDRKILFSTANGSTSNFALTDAGAFAYDVWNHVATTVDRNTGLARIYVNGVDVTTDSTIRTDFPTSQTTHIGQMVTNNFRMGGNIDDLRVYTRALTNAEISVLAGLQAPVIQVVVDNPEATLVGSWTSTTSLAGFYGANYLHDGNTAKGTKSATYTPAIPTTARYTVYGRWTADAQRANNVPIDIVSSDGTSTVVVNQRLNSVKWVSLGTFNFAAGSTGRVVIRTTGTNGFVIADAVKFVQVTASQAPPAPTSLAAATPASGQVQLTWTDNASAETGFKVYRSTDQNTWSLLTQTAANATGYLNTGLTAGTTYYYRVAATDGENDSIFATIFVTST